MANVKPSIIDDKSTHCIPFILSLLNDHTSQHSDIPFIIGLNGIQGAGKTTLVSALAETLTQAYELATLVLSIDDLYLPRDEQEKLTKSHPLNPLIQHRGEPSTHDVQLGNQLFQAILNGRECKVPIYDKSAFNGRGDRVPEEEWPVVNAPGTQKIRVVIFEGWCVGFRALPEEAVRAKQEASHVLAMKQTSASSDTLVSKTTLHKHRLEDLLFVNEHLRAYDVMTDTFDAMIHVDAQETCFVYAWRLEQEVALRRDRGNGMTDEQVVQFVDGYYPAYELFTDALREGIFRGNKDSWKGKQLRLIVGQDRKVIDVVHM